MEAGFHSFSKVELGYAVMWGVVFHISSTAYTDLFTIEGRSGAPSPHPTATAVRTGVAHSCEPRLRRKERPKLMKSHRCNMFEVTRYIFYFSSLSVSYANVWKLT